jgi:septum site-determining protein MinD
MGSQTVFLAILSAKGGVGKTTTAVNLACALSSFGRDVILVDGNYTKPNVGLQLGITNAATTIHHLLKANGDIKEAIYLHPSGIKVIPGSIIHEEIQGHYHRKLVDVLESLRGKTEIVIIDSSPGFSKEIEEVIMCADKAILVTTPDLSSITDTFRTKKLCVERGVEILGVVVTHTRNAKHELSLTDIHTNFQSDIIGSIPYDENIKFAQKAKYPVVFANLRSPASLAYKKLAANMIGEEYESNLAAKESMVTYILRRLGFK